MTAQPSRLRPFAALGLTLALFVFVGCDGGGAAPTKIYEGGGTIPEIVDQPETPAGKTGKTPKPAPGK